jgi:hypothetical protein
MFRFRLQPELSLLTVTRTGVWSLETVCSYEQALRPELAKLHLLDRPTAFIIDIRSCGAPRKNVADALRSMVQRLGALNADRTAVVTSSGIAKLEARRVADDKAQVFTSMVLARDWVMGNRAPASASRTVHSTPSNAEAEGPSVHIQGPSDVDIMLTPAAALETARRISDAAVEVILGRRHRTANGGELAA